MNAIDGNERNQDTHRFRHERLRNAEEKARTLFLEAEKRGFIRPGVSEKQLNLELYELAFELYGIKRYWHKRIVRSGPNTIHPYRENPPDRILESDEIIFFDFGPVFEEWEADFGRTYVLGADPHKLRISREIEEAWHKGKAFFEQNLNCTGADLYHHILEISAQYGWVYPQPHAGHLIGNFPHEDLRGDEVINYIHPANTVRMRDPGLNEEPRDWILEIHFVDQVRNFGGFFEQLLTVE